MNFDPYNNTQQAENTDVIKQGKRFFSRLGLALIVLLCVYFVAQTVLMYALLIAYPPSRNAWWFNWVLSLVPLYAVAVPAMYFVLRRLEKAPHGETYEKRSASIGGLSVMCQKPRLTLKMWLVMLVVGFGFTYIGNFIANFVMTVLSVLTGYDYQNSLVSLTENTPVIFTFIGTCIIAPIGEEFVFRKLLIDRTRRYGDVISILISATSFALFHGNVFQLFYAFFLGAIFAYMYTLSGRLHWSIIAHSAINTVGGVLIPMLGEHIDLEAMTSGDINALVESVMASPLPYILYALFTVAVYILMPSAIVILVISRKKLAFSEGEVKIPSERKADTILLNAGMIIAFILFVGLTLTTLLPIG